MTMPRVPERTLLLVARAGSILALSVGLWYAFATAGIAFLFFLVALAAIGIAVIHFGPRTQAGGSLPLLPLLVVLVVVLSPLALTLRGAKGTEPHWFASADEGFVLMTTRGLANGAPPADLSWAGEPVRYHLGSALLIDLMHRATRLPIHTVHYAVIPIVIRLILFASLLVLAGRVAPSLPERWRVWMPFAGGALPVLDLFNIVWHAHDFLSRGTAAVTSVSGVPIAGIESGLLMAPAYQSSALAIAYVVVLIATWRETTMLEKAALLFAVYLTKAQVFLPVGAGYGCVAMLELVRKRWQPAAAGALALAFVAPALSAGSTYGDTTHLSLGCGALCRELLTRHQLDMRYTTPLVLVLEMVLLLVGFHLFLFAIAWGARRLASMAVEARLAIAIPLFGTILAAVLNIIPSAELRERFHAVYAPVADRLYMPLPIYLDRILDVSVLATFDACTLLLPVATLPLLGAWSIAAPSRIVRGVLTASLVILLSIGAWGSSALGARQLLRPKTVPSDALEALRAIPVEARAVLTNELPWDDAAEKHLPLLNVWAPAASGRQFWASAFMFTFQHADAAERLRDVTWFFGPAATPAARLVFARQKGIDVVLLRRELHPTWPADGWILIARHGRYEVYRIAR